MMYGMLGEFISTFFLILIGVGGCIFVSKLTRLKVAFIWGFAVFIGSLFGNLFGSSKMNPVFLIVDLATKETTISILFLKLLGEILGAMFATMILLKVTKNRETNLTNYAAIASVNNKNEAFLLEIVATLSMIFMSSIIADFSNQLFNTFLMSAYIGVLIFGFAPITGASFNPIRDFVPRCVYSIHQKSWRNFKDSILSSNVAPIVSSLLWIALYYCTDV